MKQLLEKAASPANINRAWKKSRRDRAVWKQGLPKEKMEWNLAYHLLELSDQLRNGAYRPNPVRFFPVSKADGSQRIISAITLRDKVAQRAVLNVIEPLGERRFHQNSYGYRPGRTIDMALGRSREYVLCGLPWLVDADIKKFFDNIPHDLLLHELRQFISDKRINSLIAQWLDAGTFRRGFWSATKGIPQGAVLSPFLCNVYLTRFDYALSDKNLPFVRFADDFIVFCASKSSAYTALGYVRKILKKMKLELKDEKTRVALCSPQIKFLGRRMPSRPN